VKAAATHRWKGWLVTIRAKILAAFCALFGITAFLGWSAVVAIDNTGSLVVETYDKPLMSINHARAALTSLYTLKLDIEALKHSATADATRLPLDEIRSRVADLIADLDLVAERALSDNAAAAAARAKDAVRRWQNIAAGLSDGAVEATWWRLAQVEQEAIEAIDLLIEFTAGDGFLRRQEAVAEIESTRRLAIAGTLTALVLAAMIAFLLVRQILGPVAAGSTVARRIAEGDLDVDVPVSGNGELGTMLMSMAQMRDKIREMVDRERSQRFSAQARLVDAIESSPDGFILVDSDQRIVVANSRIAALLGCPASMLAPGAAFDALVRTAVASGLKVEGREDGDAGGVLAAFTDSGEPLAAQLADGGWVRVVHSVTRDGGFVAIWSDITEIKAREAALRTARDRAEAASKAKTEFLANMSHELRTPLNAIIGFSEMMHGEVLGPIGQPKYTEFAGDVLHSGRHLLGIINDILDLAKSEVGKLQIAPQPILVADLFEECQRIVGGDIDKRDLSLSVELPDLPVTVFIDPLKGRQILLNLLSNAAKFTLPGGVIHLRAKADTNGVMLAVVDTGIGMRAEDILVAMTPFGQIESGLNRKYEGTGLGLPLTKKLVELHGGTLLIDSAPGKGTSVVIRLPKALSAAA
jgi:signal transduction histidine kinase